MGVFCSGETHWCQTPLDCYVGFVASDQFLWSPISLSAVAQSSFSWRDVALFRLLLGVFVCSSSLVLSDAIYAGAIKLSSSPSSSASVTASGDFARSFGPFRLDGLFIHFLLVGLVPFGLTTPL